MTTPTRTSGVKGTRARNGENYPSHSSARTPTAMSNKGVKRASPGADIEKNPLGDVELSDEDAIKLQSVQKDVARVELALGTCSSHPHMPPSHLPPPPLSVCGATDGGRDASSLQSATHS